MVSSRAVGLCDVRQLYRLRLPGLCQRSVDERGKRWCGTKGGERQDPCVGRRMGNLYQPMGTDTDSMGQRHHLSAMRWPYRRKQLQRAAVLEQRLQMGCADCYLLHYHPANDAWTTDHILTPIVDARTRSRDGQQAMRRWQPDAWRWLFLGLPGRGRLDMHAARPWRQDAGSGHLPGLQVSQPRCNAWAARVRLSPYRRKTKRTTRRLTRSSK